MHFLVFGERRGNNADIKREKKGDNNGYRESKQQRKCGHSICDQ